MLKFIIKVSVERQSRMMFQYILCWSSSKGELYKIADIGSFNTSYVEVHHFKVEDSFQNDLSFNTSYVEVHQ